MCAARAFECTSGLYSCAPLCAGRVECAWRGAARLGCSLFGVQRAWQRPAHGSPAAPPASCCDQTIQKRAPLIRTGNSTWIGLHQYWVEGSPGNPECRSATLLCPCTPSHLSHSLTCSWHASHHDLLHYTLHPSHHALTTHMTPLMGPAPPPAPSGSVGAAVGGGSTDSQ